MSRLSAWTVPATRRSPSGRRRRHGRSRRRSRQFRRELDEGYFGVLDEARGKASRCASCRVDADS